MSKRGRCWVQILNGELVRIFRSQSAASKFEPSGNIFSADDISRVAEYPRKDATEAIRRQVFQKSGGHCRDCDKIITWNTMHMHEEVPKSKGGEVSIWNSIALCAGCHILRDDSAHGKTRRLRFGENG